MSIFLNYNDINPYAHFTKLPEHTPISPFLSKGVKYESVGAYAIPLKKWERIYLVIKALFLTVITAGLGLILGSLRETWKLGCKGTRTINVFREIPSESNTAQVYPENPIQNSTAITATEQRKNEINTQIKVPKNLQELPEDLLNHTISFLKPSERRVLFQSSKNLYGHFNKQQTKLAEALLKHIGTHFSADHPILEKLDGISKRYREGLSFSVNSKNLHEMFLEIVQEISKLQNPLQYLRAINLEKKAKELGLRIPDYFLRTITKITDAVEEVHTWVAKGPGGYPPRTTEQITSSLRIGAPSLGKDLLANIEVYNNGLVQQAKIFYDKHEEFLKDPAAWIEKEKHIIIPTNHEKVKKKQWTFEYICDYYLFFINQRKYEEAACLTSVLNYVVDNLPYDDKENCSILLLLLILAELDKKKSQEHEKLAKKIYYNHVFKANLDPFNAKDPIQIYCLYLMLNKRYEEVLECINEFEEKVQLGEYEYIPRYIIYRLLDDFVYRTDLSSITNAIEFCEKIKKESTRLAARNKLKEIINMLPKTEKILFEKFLNETPSNDVDYRRQPGYWRKETLFQLIRRDSYYAGLDTSHYDFWPFAVCSAFHGSP